MFKKKWRLVGISIVDGRFKRSIVPQTYCWHYWAQHRAYDFEDINPGHFFYVIEIRPGGDSVYAHQ